MSNYYSSQRPSKGTEIRRLLVVFGSAACLAIILTLGMLYYYNPSGVYLARNVLIAPDSASTMRFSEGESRRGNSERLVLDDIIFSFYDLDTRQIKKMHVDMKEYGVFYDLTSNDRSMEAISDDVRVLFQGSKLASMILNVRGENEQTTQSISKVFLQVDFSDSGNYYRVQLRTQGSQDTWAYFHHQGIYQKSKNIFTHSE